MSKVDDIRKGLQKELEITKLYPRSHTATGVLRRLRPSDVPSPKPTPKAIPKDRLGTILRGPKDTPEEETG